MQELVRVKYIVDSGWFVTGTVITVEKSKAEVLLGQGKVKILHAPSGITNKSFADKRDLIKRV